MGDQVKEDKTRNKIRKDTAKKEIMVSPYLVMVYEVSKTGSSKTGDGC